MRLLGSLGLALVLIVAVGCEDDPTPPRLDGMQADGPVIKADSGDTDGDTPSPDGQGPSPDGAITDGPVTTTDSTADGPVTTTDSTVDGPVTTADSTVDGPITTADSTVDGPVTAADSTVDTTAPVGQVIFASVPETGGNTWVGSNASEVPVRGIYLDQNGAPVRGTTITYSISGPATVAADGDVTGGTLSGNVNRELATLTASAPSANSSLNVAVVRKTQSTVTVTGTFNYLVSTNPGTVTLTHVQSGANTTVAANGNFSIDLPAGSFYTLRASAPQHASSHFSGVAPMTDTNWGTTDLAMLSTFMFNIQLAIISCASNDANTGILAGQVPGPGPDGWEVFIAAPGATVAYVGEGSQLPDCARTTTASSGQFTAFSTPFGLHWLVARKLVGGQYQYRTALAHISAAGFSLAVGWQ